MDFIQTRILVWWARMVANRACAYKRHKTSMIDHRGIARRRKSGLVLVWQIAIYDQGCRVAIAYRLIP